MRLASDARLVTLVRQGWPAAFEAVYNRHQRGILSFCRHVLSDADEAEDAVQHTFLAAYNDLIASDKPIHLRAWLFTIARNRCYSILRARREQPAADLDEPVTEGLATQVQRRQDLRDLIVDLRGLPDEQRAALVLAELDALSHEQIGQALGVPRDKVKALVFQARESLVASRTARETACADIREQLASGRGGTLRRANLRRHLRDCSGCRDFRRQVERQRRQLAALLPVAPTLALKETVLTGTSGSGAGFGGGGVLASTALKSGMLKGFATLALATAGTAGTYVATHQFHGHASSSPAVRSQPRAPAATVSRTALRPTGPRTVVALPSSVHAAGAAAHPPRSLGAIRLTPRTVPIRVRSGALTPFGPLAHSRASFPRAPGRRLHTIAPPASTPKPAVPTAPAPVIVVSPPSVPIPPTTPVDHAAGDPTPTSDRPSTGEDAHAVTPGSVGRPRSAASSTGSVPAHGGSTSGHPAAGRYPPKRGSSEGRVVGKSPGPVGRSPSPVGKSPGPASGPPAPAGGKPRAITAPGTASSPTVDPGRGTDAGASKPTTGTVGGLLEGIPAAVGAL